MLEIEGQVECPAVNAHAAHRMHTKYVYYSYIYSMILYIPRYRT